ncbi:unnamed protein product [Periconia digitata]|uniref:Vacuolar import and degradation protein-domain-containing protein n=1 Tax=Periconia digitata TaxID=1303443 RepID=A0A9W4UCW1_9PLEO|nr:unnamed protein product [Periconia digitata]
MPPNPPADPSERPRTPPSYISTLSDALESPVTSNTSLLANTLINPGDHRHVRPTPTVGVRHGSFIARRALRRQEEPERLERNRANHLRQVLDSLSRLPGDSQIEAPYGDRVPSQNRLYDWSPASRPADNDDVSQEELVHILSGVRRDYPDTHPNILRVMARFQYNHERGNRAEPLVLTRTTHSRSTAGRLRSPDTLENMRRLARQDAYRLESPQLRPFTRSSRIARYRAERDARDREREQGAERLGPPAMTERPTSQEQDQAQDQARDQARLRDMRARVDSYHRRHLERNTDTASTGSTMMENTIKYLSRIRYSNCLDDSLNHAIDLGLKAKKKEFNNDRHDFVVMPHQLPSPTYSSWLAPGAVLSGCQHATTDVPSITVNTNGRRHATTDDVPSITVDTNGRRHATTDDVPSITVDTNGRRHATTDDVPSITVDTNGRRHATTDDVPSITVDTNGRRHATTDDVPSIVVNTTGRRMYARRGRPAISSSMVRVRRPHDYRPGRGQPPRQTATSNNPQQDRWPVKVTIHSVDYEQMSLSATMEAYNVPSHPHQHQSLLAATGEGNASFTRTSSITTYLEGEILDFNTHTLLTESFQSTAHNDATYWSKLPPFEIYSDAELRHNLSSIRWFEDVLSKEWILMRWKERCFVKPYKPPSVDSPALDQVMESDSDPLPAPSDPPQPSWTVGAGDTEHGMFDDSGCGLTISGFYYVCLRRSDGRLDGLYYDPQSSPYQCLKLESVRGGALPAWEFK